jgi:hypothetical protein
VDTPKTTRDPEPTSRWRRPKLLEAMALLLVIVVVAAGVYVLLVDLK